MLQVEQVPISVLVEYENNVKIHTDEQVRKIADSIEQFGMNAPIGIDENNVIIYGHGRKQACELLGMEYVPCIRLEHMTEQQKKAYILADNKLNMETGFDLKALEEEIATITDFDMSDFGFEVPEFDFDVDSDRTRDEERFRTDRKYNLDKVNINDCDGYWDMPTIEREEVEPDYLLAFDYITNTETSGFGEIKEYGVHFYRDDYRFERVWNEPDKYISCLSKAQCVLMPDFSLYMDMPLPMKLWNVYRARALAHYWQKNGIKVVPSLTWADKKSYDYCFNGIPEGAIVAVSTVGVRKDERAMEIWTDGMNEAIKRIKPKKILLYGDNFGYDFGETPVREYESNVKTRINAWKDRKAEEERKNRDDNEQEEEQ